MRLIDCFLKVLAYTSYLRKDYAKISASHDEVRADYDELFVEGRDMALYGGFSNEEYDNASFAVCAWVDETILLSRWPGKNDWAASPLQRKQFNTMNAGEEFFERLNALPADDYAVREVFAVCMSLGFTGKYYDPSSMAELNKLKKETLSTVLGRDIDSDDYFEGRLFPEAYPQGVQDSGKSRFWRRTDPLMVGLMLLPPAIFISLFVLYRFYLIKIIYEYFGGPI